MQSSIKDFLKPKNFNIKPKAIRFESVQYMSDLEKAKIYVAFVKFLNNHFKATLWNKNLYEHFHQHCGFIAHYNIHGFYGEYFETAANFHFNVNGFSNPMHECAGNLNVKSALSHGEQFYTIYEELNKGGYDGLGGFYNTIMNNRNYGGYAEYSDLDNAIKDAFSEYMEIWREEIRKAIKAHDQFLKNEEVAKLKAKETLLAEQEKELKEAKKQLDAELMVEIEKSKAVEEVKPVVKKVQLSLFDFAA
jgi:hypothetical protein